MVRADTHQGGAFTTSAFNKVPKSAGTQMSYSFEYTPPSTDPYSVANVEDTANWHYNASAAECPGDDEACALLNVPATYVNTGSTPTLKSSINIDAVESSPGIAKVNATAAGSATISNQTE